jgi:hypothetical protein
MGRILSTPTPSRHHQCIVYDVIHSCPYSVYKTSQVAINPKLSSGPPLCSQPTPENPGYKPCANMCFTRSGEKVPKDGSAQQMISVSPADKTVFCLVSHTIYLSPCSLGSNGSKEMR